MNFQDETVCFQMMREKLYTAVICDILDEFGFRNQVLDQNIRPVNVNWKIVGRTKTILAVDIFETYENPYEKEIEAIDSVKLNEVIMIGTNNSKRSGLWGELLATASRMRGATGVILDGLIRDSEKLINMDFPVFCSGYNPLDSKGREYVISYDCPVEVGGVLVHPGDVVFGDRDGIVIIPKKVFPQTVERALEKVNNENMIRNELLAGKLLKEVYDQYKML
ncbi:Regulator of RNase E activity RraA [Paenibacillus tianmuensis]|uniref:Putative 4-hydroxy-4-methyl-2-oxoglutarate aldolase n=1 Tax=Paenibacillus tianmuensis TaxID=624147 RepID=A0A1G4PQ03_9BACL|nr:RraA family protein [Paenibacillus tianmuensis]SCW34414.1 Regulator of RNase E activity RraA [Paenibacillus tianmuensis]